MLKALDKSGTNLGIILGIPGVESYNLKVKPAVKIHLGNNVLGSGNNALNSYDVLLFKSEGNRLRRSICRGRRGRTSGHVWDDGHRGAVCFCGAYMNSTGDAGTRRVAVV